MLDPTTMIAGATALVSAGAAWAGVKVALNGTKERMTEMKVSLDKHIEDDRLAQLDAVGRMASMDTKLDILLKDN